MGWRPSSYHGWNFISQSVWLDFYFFFFLIPEVIRLWFYSESWPFLWCLCRVYPAGFPFSSPEFGKEIIFKKKVFSGNKLWIKQQEKFFASLINFKKGANCFSWQWENWWGWHLIKTLYFFLPRALKWESQVMELNKTHSSGFGAHKDCISWATLKLMNNTGLGGSPQYWTFLTPQWEGCRCKLMTRILKHFLVRKYRKIARSFRTVSSRPCGLAQFVFLASSKYLAFSRLFIINPLSPHLKPMLICNYPYFIGGISHLVVEPSFELTPEPLFLIMTLFCLKR